MHGARGLRDRPRPGAVHGARGGQGKLRNLEVWGRSTPSCSPDARRRVANEAIVQAQAGFDLMCVQLPDVDIAGHSQAWMSKAYLEQLAEADVAIGRLPTRCLQETTIIVSSSTGGRATVHGSTIPRT